MNRMNKHTPGPWKIVTGNSVREFGEASIRPVKSPFKGILLPIASVRYPNHAFGIANACLIAAAPDLLEALQNLENDDGSIPHHAWAMVQTAIAKATGVQP